MRKNQKYTQEEMYNHIVRWKKSGLSQKQYSNQEGFPVTTFSHWIIKYRNEQQAQKVYNPKPFIPVEITSFPTMNISMDGTNCITITYPTGIQVTCPLTINIEHLRTLIKL